MEADFEQIGDVAYDRLKPEAITAFLWVTFAIGAGMAFFVSDTVDYSVNITNPIWSSIIQANIVLLVIHFLVCLFFSKKNFAYKFQRIQAVILCLVAIKFSFEFYPFYFLAVEDRFAPGFMTTVGLLLLIGGIVYLVISTVRAIGRVKKGELKENGQGLYHFKNSKTYVSLPIIFGATMLGGAIGQILSNSVTTIGEMTGLFFILLLTVVIQYAIAMVWPEFFLLAYGKFRFESFRLKMPKASKVQKNIKTNGKKVKR